MFTRLSYAFSMNGCRSLCGAYSIAATQTCAYFVKRYYNEALYDICWFFLHSFILRSDCEYFSPRLDWNMNKKDSKLIQNWRIAAD